MLAQLHFDIAALGDLDGVFQGLRQVAEQLGHFFGAFKVLLFAVILRTARVIQGSAFADAHSGFVGLEIFLLDKTHIIGRHQRCTEFVGQCYGGVQVLFIVGPIGALHFQIETVGKNLHPLAGQHFGFLRIAAQQRDTDLALFSGGQHDQPFAGFGHPLALDDDRAIALTVDKTAGNQFGEVAIADAVHRQQADAAQGVVGVFVGQPQVGAADRLDAGGHGIFIELDQGTHVVLISHRYRRHVHARQGFDQGFDPYQAVDQGVFSVQAQVNE